MEIFGILNVTEDSFSDGGLYLAPERAIAQARDLAAAGADVLDLGAASSHPDAAFVEPAEEIRRLAPVLDALARDDQDVRVSVDSYHPEVQRFAISRGVEFLNDINGFAMPEFYGELAASSCKLVAMHSIQRSGAADREYADPAKIFDEVCAFFEERLSALVRGGVAEERLIVDPGMGFFLGRDARASTVMLRKLPELKARFGRPVFVSVSRKSFLGSITGRPASERGAGTLAAELWAVFHGDVDYVRTHDVRALVDGVKVWAAI